MEQISWIKELVKAEQQMEESGMIDMSSGIDTDRLIVSETIRFMLQIKNCFIDASSAFNELKSSAIGRIKIYGIAKTHADFMLFRNGFKMIFSMKAPGQISIRFNFIGTNFMTPTTGTDQSVQQTIQDEQIVEAKCGPFGEVIWTYQGQPFKIDYMVQYYLSLFVRESTK